MPGGKALVKTTKLAVFGPLLVTVKRYVRGLPATAGAGEAVPVTARSASWLTGVIKATDKLHPLVTAPTSPGLWSFT